MIPSKKSSNRRQSISSSDTYSNLNNKNNINLYPYQIFEFQN